MVAMSNPPVGEPQMFGDASEQPAESAVDPRTLTASLGPYGGSVSLGGRDISASLHGITIRHRVPHLAEVELDAVVYDATVHAEDPHVVIPDATHDLLVQLGWTPPAQA